MRLIELGGIVISQAVQRSEFSAMNITNAAVPGYKARYSFSGLLSDATLGPKGISEPTISIDFRDAKLQSTGNSLDIAVSGTGFFVVRKGEEFLYTRNGQLKLDDEGRLMLSDGAVLQSDRGDIVVGSGPLEVQPDGVIAQSGQPVSQIRLVDFSDPRELSPVGAGLFRSGVGAERDVANPRILQGFLEASNVSAAEEMIAMMAAIRSVESGQRVVQVYDDLLGRVITSFAQPS